MSRKENTAIVLYTPEHKYALFKYKNGKYGLPCEKLNEQDDNYCPPLGVSRHILTEISGGFQYEMLTEDVQIEGTVSELSNKFDSNDWHKLWMSLEYNVWIDKLSESDFSEHQINGSHYQIYYVQINQQLFASNMQKLQIEYLFLTLQEIKELQNANDVSKLIINSGINFQKEIDLQNELKQSPNTKENTYIFILHKALHFREKLKIGMPEMPTKAFYLGLFKKSNQKWLIYNAGQRYLPPNDVLENAKAIVQPGSSSSAYDYSEWTVEYREWIKNIYFQYPHLKFLSICFGEQILAHSLNGRCGQLEERKKNPQFYNVQIEQLNMQDDFYNLSYVSSLNIPKRPLRICKAHGDIVEELDKNLFQVVGSSEKYHVEVYINVPSEDNKVLCFQGHPEYAGQWICRKDSQFYSYIMKIDLESAMKMVYTHYPIDNPDDHIILRQICQSFLLS